MNNSESRLYIIGAGFAGRMIAKDILSKRIIGSVAAFLDDDKNLIGTQMDGIPVLGPIESMTNALHPDPSVDQALIAIPSTGTDRIREIELTDSAPLHLYFTGNGAFCCHFADTCYNVLRMTVKFVWRIM